MTVPTSPVPVSTAPTAHRVRSVLAIPAFRRLWIGNALSAVVSQRTLLAVSLEVYALTGSSFHVGLLGLFAMVPLVLAGLYGGSIADAYDRRPLHTNRFSMNRLSGSGW